MSKTSYMRLKGSKHFRQRLLLSTLSSTPLIIEEIRPDDSWPGLRPHEVSFLRLLETVSDDCSVVINETGTKLKYKPGVVIGGKHLVHDCGLSRSISYFLEPLIVLGLFGKKPLSITLIGITNDSKDPSVDTFRTTTLHMLEHFGVPLEGLELKIKSRGCPPQGGGEVDLGVPMIHNSLSAVTWVDEGLVKSIRGVSFSTRVSPQVENRMIHSARGIFNRLLPDVHIFTDHKSGPESGRSPGYGISLVAKTTTGCLISADTAVYCARGDDKDDIEDYDNKPELVPPEELGVQVASVLLGEIDQGGVVDSSHQMVKVMPMRKMRHPSGKGLSSHIAAAQESIRERISCPTGIAIAPLCFMPSRCVQGSCWKAHAIRNRDAETYKGFPWCQVRYQARSIDKYCHTQMRRMWVEESIKKDFMIVCFRTLLTNGWAYHVEINSNYPPVHHQTNDSALYDPKLFMIIVGDST